MQRSLTGNTRSAAARRATQAGTALLEVLVALLVMGVGLLALLTLFPLGALDMAQAIKDDRTAAVAADAIALSQTGTELVSQTADFIDVSLAIGSVDSSTAAQLRQAYQDLDLQAEDVQTQLEDLKWAFPPEQIRPHLGPLLAQVRSIRLHLIPIIRIFSLFDDR